MSVKGAPVGAVLCTKVTYPLKFQRVSMKLVNPTFALLLQIETFRRMNEWKYC